MIDALYAPEEAGAAEGLSATDAAAGDMEVEPLAALIAQCPSLAMEEMTVPAFEPVGDVRLPFVEEDDFVSTFSGGETVSAAAFSTVNVACTAGSESASGDDAVVNIAASPCPQSNDAAPKAEIEVAAAATLTASGSCETSTEPVAAMAAALPTDEATPAAASEVEMPAAPLAADVRPPRQRVRRRPGAARVEAEAAVASSPVPATPAGDWEKSLSYASTRTNRSLKRPASAAAAGCGPSPSCASGSGSSPAASLSHWPMAIAGSPTSGFASATTWTPSSGRWRRTRSFCTASRTTPRWPSGLPSTDEENSAWEPSAPADR